MAKHWNDEEKERHQARNLKDQTMPQMLMLVLIFDIPGQEWFFIFRKKRSFDPLGIRRAVRPTLLHTIQKKRSIRKPEPLRAAQPLGNAVVICIPSFCRGVKIMFISSIIYLLAEIVPYMRYLILPPPFIFRYIKPNIVHDAIKH